MERSRRQPCPDLMANYYTASTYTISRIGGKYSSRRVVQQRRSRWAGGSITSSAIRRGYTGEYYGVQYINSSCRAASLQRCSTSQDRQRALIRHGQGANAHGQGVSQEASDLAFLEACLLRNLCKGELATSRYHVREFVPADFVNADKVGDQNVSVKL